MTPLRITLIVVLSLILLGGAGYLYASSGIKSKPGYVQLSLPKPELVDAQLSLNLGPSGVAPVRWLIGQALANSNTKLDAPEKVLNSVLQDLQGMQLRIYDVHNNAAVIDEAISDSLRSLRTQGWETLVKVREKDEHVLIMQSSNDAEIAGLSMLVRTPDTAVFLNLIGPFNADDLDLAMR